MQYNHTKAATSLWLPLCVSPAQLIKGSLWRRVTWLAALHLSPLCHYWKQTQDVCFIKENIFACLTSPCLMPDILQGSAEEEEEVGVWWQRCRCTEELRTKKSAIVFTVEVDTNVPSAFLIKRTCSCEWHVFHLEDWSLLFSQTAAHTCKLNSFLL